MQLNNNCIFSPSWGGFFFGIPAKDTRQPHFNEKFQILFKKWIQPRDDGKSGLLMLLLIISFGIFLFISLQINRYFKYRTLLDWCLGAFCFYSP